jgi:Bacterial low temperature requirement A protein (LtrA)
VPGVEVARLLRDRTGLQRVTNIELFFDLVYVFAVTQLSHYLLGHADLAGALQAGLLLLMVWLVWSHDLGHQLARPGPDGRAPAARRPRSSQARPTPAGWAVRPITSSIP